MKLFTSDEFIIQANLKHNNLFDYSLIQFPIRKTQKIKVVDPEFGVFVVEANRHLNGKTNMQRANRNKGAYRKSTIGQFIKRANDVHQNRYDYSKVNYINMVTKVCIIDPEFGEFWQTPAGHLSGQGHPELGKIKAANKRRTPLEQFIHEANKIHGNLYDYTKVEYVHCDKKICIIDPEFGEFWQSPYQHLRSHGCPERTKQRKWIIHNDHIIPLSIIRSTKRGSDQWDKNRPLYKFLNSDINFKNIPAKQNRDKSDQVTINGKTVLAHTVRNNYDIIGLLIKQELNFDPTDLIEQDKKFIKEYFDL